MIRAFPGARRHGLRRMVVAGSAVYAALGSSGHRLYILDAVQHREYAYEREADGSWSTKVVAAGIRESGRRLIREHVYALNHAYRVTDR